MQCEICLKEVPASEAMSSEACDYVIHFCGIDCHRIWAQKKAPADEGAPSEAQRKAQS